MSFVNRGVIKNAIEFASTFKNDVSVSLAINRNLKHNKANTIK